MPSKKLITLLETLNGHHLNRFRRYLSAPFFNENELLPQLLDLVAPYANSKAPTEGDYLAQKKAVWRGLFAQKNYQDAALRRLISELLRHLTAFLAFEHYRNDPRREQEILLHIFNKPALQLHFASAIRQIEETQRKTGLHNADYHYYRYLTEEHLFQHREKTQRGPEMLYNMANASYHLDCYYIMQRLKHYCGWLDYKNVFAVAVDMHLPAGFLEWLKTTPYLTEPGVRMYYLLTQLLLQPALEEYYYELKQLLSEQGDLFTIEELRFFYFAIMNYCIDKKINAGNTAFFTELFDIYLILLKKDILIESGVFDAQHYKIIITIGLQLQKFDWVEDFIQSYTNKLPPEEQANALTYNLAKVHFQQAHYNKVIELLREVEYQSINYALGGKLMLLKTYYELNEYLALDSLVDSFRIYLRRNKLISKEVRQQYLNVLRFIKKMSVVRPGDQAAIARIRHDIEACHNLADKNWILQKIKELAPEG